ncbi:hypothetical protein [Janibacter sp. GS2]|uniref:hypothetical protein n=1 Tax=Janibacter sp. GS2 TaxID=3442646 RepID=UPI003EB864B5
MSEEKKRHRIARYAGATVSGLPIVGPIVQELATDAIDVVIAEQTRLRSTALRAAERSAGMTREEISDALVASPHLVPLVSRVLWTAGMSGDDEILEVLGGMLGSILLAPDDTEEAELLLAGIADLKRIHLQVLRKLREPPMARVKTEQSFDPVDNFEAALTDGALPPRSPDREDFVLQSADAWNAEALAYATGLSLTRTQLALTGLMNAGFALSPTVTNGPGYRVSPAGTLVWEAIQRWQVES